MTACSLARFHVPGQPAPDQHHVIPRAWMGFWQPAGKDTEDSWDAYGNLTLAKPAVWDPRTVAVCPNHHRLIHEAIVALMRGGKGSEDPLDARDATFGRGRLTRAETTAYLALCRWKEAGGSLEALRNAGEWGGQ